GDAPGNATLHGRGPSAGAAWVTACDVIVTFSSIVWQCLVAAASRGGMDQPHLARADRLTLAAPRPRAPRGGAGTGEGRSPVSLEALVPVQVKPCASWASSARLRRTVAVAVFPFTIAVTG